MSARLDLAAYNRDDQLVLVVEVKKKFDASPAWAAQLRRNILAHGIFPNAPFFLLTFPDRFYLWKNNGGDSESNKPQYIIDAQPILKRYFEQTGVTAKQISGQSFELIIASWLGELVHSGKRPEEMKEHQDWLVESGLYEAIAGGRLEHEVAA